MTGKETPELTADFTIDGEKRTVICPAGKEADRAVYSEKSDSWKVSFLLDKSCEGCPYNESGNCPLKKMKHVRSGKISAKMIQRAEIQKSMSGPEFMKNYRFRNGVEAIPSQLRRVQNIDHMPFRGLLRK